MLGSVARRLVGAMLLAFVLTRPSFDLPGTGQLLVSSLGGAGPDLHVIMGIVLVVCFAVVPANLIVDLLYPLVDPRIHLYGKGGSSAGSRAPRRRLRARQPVTSESAT